METKRAGWVMAVLGFVLSAGLVCGESLYVVSHGSRVFSFDVYNGQLIPIGEASMAVYGYGGIDLAIDNDYDILFMSSENTDNFQILDAKELTLIKTVTFPGTGDITGIVYDAANSRLLGTQRNTNDLYVFSWTPATQTLTLDETIQLAYIQNACDAAINGDTLYVSEYRYSLGGIPPTYKEIYAYDMSDNFSFIEKIGMGDYCVSIDYNATDNTIYGGAFDGHENILKRTLDPNTLTIGDIGAKATGIATNSDAAGRVFITSYANGGSVQWWDISSSDPNNWNMVDAYTNADNSNLAGLAGLVVGDDYIEPRLTLTKTHDANSCVSPGEPFNYTISWYNDTDETATDVTLVDYLPSGVDYDYLISISPLVVDSNYISEGHYYQWLLDDIAPYTGGSVNLEVTVNTKAEPGLWLHNIAVMTSSLGNTTTEIIEPNVCCWDSGTILYVDQTAAGDNNGTSWDDAYTDLQDAFTRARETSCIPGPNTIYVAQGTYSPGYDPAVSFELLDNMSVYGGFKGGSVNPGERDSKKYKTILTGDFDNDGFPDVDFVVTMGDETLLDGFTVTQTTLPSGRCIYGNGVDFEVANCTVTESGGYGIYAQNGNVAVKWCTANSNFSDGIRHEGAGFTLSVDNSWILRNGEYGINCEDSTPIVKNSIVSESDLVEAGLAGIRLYRPTSPPVLYNLTVSNNKAEGIYFEDNHDIYNDPNNLDYPDVQNCIVYYNNGGGRQLAGFDADNIATYCCIQDCNEVNNNYNDAPGFAYAVDPAGTPDPNNYHLAYDGFCKEKANPYLSYEGQVDMDGEGDDRKYGYYVDIGADEVYSCDEPLTEDDVYNPMDWNANGVVNYVEFTAFSRAWLSCEPNFPGNPNNWNPICNLDQTGDSEHKIDLADLELFISDTPWLWEACWRDNFIEMYGLMGGGESMMMSMSMEFDESSFEDEEENAYTDMSLPELVQFIQGIHEVIDQLEVLIDQAAENAENASELKTFLEGVLLDIKESRQ